MQKKAQAQDILIYALTSIIVILVLFFGYKAIKGLGTAQEEAVKVKLKTDLKNAIDEGSSYGKKSTPELEVPTEYRELCFMNINSKNMLNFIPPEALTELNKRPLIKESIGGKDNAFLVKEDGNIDPFEVGKIEIWLNNDNLNDGFVCFDVEENTVKIRIEGKGDRTIVRKAAETTLQQTAGENDELSSLENDISEIEGDLADLENTGITDSDFDI